MVFGLGLGPSLIERANAFPLPTVLADTSVRIQAGEKVFSALMLYTSFGQVAAVLPSAVPAGDHTLILTYKGKDSDPQPIRVVRGRFGIFARNQAGSAVRPPAPGSQPLPASTSSGCSTPSCS